MPIVTPRTIYENVNAAKFFYSTERHGFTKVSEAVWDFIELGRNKNLFEVKHLTLIDNDRAVESQQPNITTLSNLALTANIFASNYAVTISNLVPLYGSAGTANLNTYGMRVRSIQAAGTGYKVGNELYFYDNTQTKQLKIVVTGIDLATGGVTNFEVHNPGSYATAANTSKAMVFRTRSNPLAAFESNLDYSDGTFTFQGAVSNSTGSAVTPPAANITGVSGLTVNDWQSKHGSNGIGTFNYELTQSANIEAEGTRWPVTGIWTNVSPYDAKIFVGQELMLKLPAFGSSSNIAANTIITSIVPINVVNGAQILGDKLYETFTSYLYMTVSQPITVTKGDQFYVKGSGLRINDSVTREPDAFKVIVEAREYIEPTNGYYVTGNVTTSNGSPIITVTNLQNNLGGSYITPTVYDGMNFESTATVKSANTAVVISSNITGSTGTFVLSANQGGVTNNEPVIFKFDNKQPWRLAFEIPNPQVAIAYAATDVQLQDNGTIARVTNWQGNVVDRSGMMGDAIALWDSTQSGNIVSGSVLGNVKGNLVIKPDIMDEERTELGFYNRKKRVSTYPEAYPLNYIMTATNRGLFFGMYEGNWSVAQKSETNFKNQKDSWFSWFLIQRPVDRVTGKVYTAGRAPVFCINSVGYRYWKFIVRESDAMHPTQGDPEQLSQYLDASGNVITQVTPFRVPADQHTIDSHAILNTTDQIALTEDSKFLISFLHNLTTPRFRYSQELDMLGQTSADVCMAGNDISITAYSETSSRTYRALPANKPYNAGLRIVVLKEQK